MVESWGVCGPERVGVFPALVSARAEVCLKPEDGDGLRTADTIFAGRGIVSTVGGKGKGVNIVSTRGIGIKEGALSSL